MILLSLITWALAAICNSAMDTMQHHFGSSIFFGFKPAKFWDPSISWKNKYADNKKWYGWINDTILVWITDGWHLAQMLMKSLIVLTILLYKPIISWQWDAFLFTLIWGVVFEVFYKYIFKKS